MRRVFLLPLILVLCLNLYASENPLQEGFSFLERGNFNSAFSVFSGIKQKNSNVHAGMGMAKYLAKDYNSATSYLKKALKSPTERQNWVTNYFAGLSCFELGDYKKAVNYLNNALKIKDLPEIALYLGKAVLVSGKPLEAERLFIHVIERDPKLLEAYLELLRIYETRKQFELSFKLIEKAKSQLGEDPMLIYQSAKLHFILGKMDIAERELNIALKKQATKEMQTLYSSLKKNRETVEGLVRPGKKPEQSLFKKYRLIFAAGLFLLFMAIFANYKTRKNAAMKKTEYANELLKKGDIGGAEEILSELIGQGRLSDSIAVVRTKLYCLKSDFENAWNTSVTITNKDLQLFIQGLLLLAFEKKADMTKHLMLIENSGCSTHLHDLKRLCFENPPDAIKALLEHPEL